MNEMFSKARRGKKGYQPNQVEKFLEKARADFQYLGVQEIDTRAIDIRSVSFDLVPQGYSVDEVDEALDRLETVFFEREYDRNLAEQGALAMHNSLEERIDSLVTITEKEPKKRFRLADKEEVGYSVKEVDKFIRLVHNHFTESAELSSATIRQIGFSAKRRGYVDSDVDPFIDELIEVLMIQELDAKNREVHSA